MENAVVHGDAVAVEGDFRCLVQQLFVLVGDDPPQLGGFLPDGGVRQGRKVQLVDEIGLGIVPVRNEAVGEGKTDAGEGFIRVVANRTSAGFTGDGVAVAFKGGNTAVRSDVHGPLQ